MSVDRSQLISEDENRKFRSILNNGSKILASTVARLYQASNGEWQYVCTGIVTLTKDTLRKKYLLQIYSLDNLCLAWEYIFAINFVYNEFKKQIHTFSADDIPTLLSFASFDESNKFKDEMFNVLKQRKELKARKRQSQVTSTYSSGVDLNQMTDIKSVSKLQPKPSQTKKGKLTKNDISNPSNFRHVDHMGLNDHFFSNPNDENLKNFLKKNHMENLLNNEEEIRGIYDFIDQRGGLEKLESEMKQQQQQQQQQSHMRKAPAVPQKVAPPPPDRFHSVATPAQNYRPPPTGPVGPPPPPIGHMAPPPPPIGVGVPPPPPPPPPPPAPAPPPIHVAAKPTGIANNATPPVSGKGGLLAEIEKFDAKKLKARSQADGSDVPAPAPAAGGSLLDSLAQYLVQRKTLITGTSDSEDEDNDDEDDDEWKE